MHTLHDTDAGDRGELEVNFESPIMCDVGSWWLNLKALSTCDLGRIESLAVLVFDCWRHYRRDLGRIESHIVFSICFWLFKALSMWFGENWIPYRVQHLFLIVQGTIDVIWGELNPLSCSAFVFWLLKALSTCDLGRTGQRLDRRDALHHHCHWGSSQELSSVVSKQPESLVHLQHVLCICSPSPVSQCPASPFWRLLFMQAGGFCVSMFHQTLTWTTGV